MHSTGIVNANLDRAEKLLKVHEGEAASAESWRDFVRSHTGPNQRLDAETSSCIVDMAEQLASKGITASGYHSITRGVGFTDYNLHLDIASICRDSFSTSKWSDNGFSVLKNAAQELSHAHQVHSVIDKNFTKVLGAVEKKGRNEPSQYARICTVLTGIIAQAELQRSEDSNGSFEKNSAGDKMTRFAYNFWQRAIEDEQFERNPINVRYSDTMLQLCLACVESAPETSHLMRPLLYASMVTYLTENLKYLPNIEERMNQEGPHTRTPHIEPSPNLANFSLPDYRRLDFNDRSQIEAIKQRIKVVKDGYSAIIGKKESDDQVPQLLIEPGFVSEPEKRNQYGTKEQKENQELIEKQRRDQELAERKAEMLRVLEMQALELQRLIHLQEQQRENHIRHSY